MPKISLDIFRNARNKPLLHITLIVILCCLAYSNSLDVPFEFDDIHQIVENPIVKDLFYFSDFDAAREFPTFHGLQMRTIGYFSLAVNYKFGGTSVTGYHIFNLLIHLLNSVLVYRLVCLTLKISKRIPENLARSAPLLALCVALLFAVHPIQTQAVTYVIQRITSLAAFFCLLSLTAYIDSRRSMIEKNHVKTILWLVIATASMVAAMKTKEIAFTFPIIIVLYEFIFLNSSLKKRLFFLLPLLLTMLIIPLSLVGSQKPVGEVMISASDVTRVARSISRVDYLTTQFKVIVSYLRLLVFPVNQNLDYDHPVYTNFWNPWILLCFLFLTALFIMAIYLSGFRLYHLGIGPKPDQLTPQSSRLVGFGLLWFFIALSVESTIIPINDLMVEHRLYLPSAGFFMAIVVCGWLLTQHLKKKWPGFGKVTIIVSAAIVLTFSGMTYTRNYVWSDSLRLWQDVVSKSPWNPRGYNNIGIYYDQRGEYAKAIPYFQKAVSIRPEYSEALVNLGIAHASLKQTDLAITYYKKALAVRPKDPKLLYNLGVSLLSKGDFESASSTFQKALRIDPGMTQARTFLEYARRQMGR